MKVTAYGVHLITALGAALGLWSVILTMDGFFQESVWVLAAAVFLDSIDGTLARYFDTKTHAPEIDGALLDNIVDFLTWTVAPLFWAYASMNLPLWIVMVCAVASALGFANTEAKTSDYYFLGFPSYWNIVVFYLFLLQLPVYLSLAILLVFAVTTVAPVRFIYPNRTPDFRLLTMLLGIIYSIQLLLLIILFDDSPAFLIYSSFIFPVYYFTMSFYLNIKQSETSPET